MAHGQISPAQLTKMKPFLLKEMPVPLLISAEAPGCRDEKASAYELKGYKTNVLWKGGSMERLELTMRRRWVRGIMAVSQRKDKGRS